MSAATVHLVDASPYIFRAYFSLPPDMVSPDGRPVNAVYGYAHFLLQLIDGHDVSHLALTYDRSLTTSFRNDVYPAYKQQRDLPPPELEDQLDGCVEIGAALGCASFIDDRYEADDLIATLCHQLRPEADAMVIVTSDKDLAQLVDERVTLLDFARDEVYGIDEVVAKFGVRPAQIADFLGLAGDSVDNIPGVRGVGKKTAAALLEAFADLDDLYAHLDRVADLPIRGAKTLGAKLAEHRDLAFLSRQLATVSREAPAAAVLDDLRLQGADPELLDPLVEKLGFDRFRPRVKRWKK